MEVGVKAESAGNVLNLAIEAVSNGWLIRVVGPTGMSTCLVERLRDRDNIEILLAICERLLRGEQ